MYLRWRGTTLEALQADPESYRSPDSVDETHEPTDGGTHVGPRTDGGVSEPTEGDSSQPTGVSSSEASVDETATNVETEIDPTTEDAWAAERFFESIEGSAYGSTPDQLRQALDLLSGTDRQQLWVSPGLPFVVPMFFGLLIAFSYGDLLFGLFGWLGLL
jgi:preflagellin peptidase FlaK